MSIHQPPMYIEASTPEELREEMIRINVQFNRRFHFFDIQHVEGSWFAWYEIGESERLMKEVNDGDQ